MNIWLINSDCGVELISGNIQLKPLSLWPTQVNIQLNISFSLVLFRSTLRFLAYRSESLFNRIRVWSPHHPNSNAAGTPNDFSWVSLLNCGRQQRPTQWSRSMIHSSLRQHGNPRHRGANHLEMHAHVKCNELCGLDPGRLCRAGVIKELMVSNPSGRITGICNQGWFLFPVFKELHVLHEAGWGSALMNDRRKMRFWFHRQSRLIASVNLQHVFCKWLSYLVVLRLESKHGAGCVTP